MCKNSKMCNKSVPRRGTPSGIRTPGKLATIGQRLTARVTPVI
jgi:hypothetical protein